jgi:photosystem II stability/assembly factor-like uncharacterized protein
MENNMKNITAIIATSLLLQTVFNVSHAASDSLDTWHWRNPLPQGSQLVGVAYGNNTYVAVGPNGTVLTSPDAFTWTLENPGTTEALGAVAFGNGLFIVVGRNGSILTSPDGKSWIDRSLNPFHQLIAVVYGNNMFVATGEQNLQSSENLLTSADGLTWTPRIIDTDVPLNSVTFGNGLFVAVGGNSFGNGTILTSPDGISWTPQPATSITGVAYGNGRFVAVGGGPGTNVLTSTNGLDWTPQDASGVRSAITFGNGLFVATDGSFEAKVHTSPDGVAWESHPFPRIEFANGVAYGAGQFVVVGNWGSILGSTNGMDWTLRIQRSGSGQDLTGIASDGHRLVVLETSSGKLVSDDGTVWHHRPTATRTFLYGIAHGAGVFVAVGATNSFFIPTPNHIVVETSSDGDTWTHQELPDSGILRAVAFGNHRFVAVGEGSPSLIVTSSDGITWTRRSDPQVLNTLRDTIFANETFVAVGNGGHIFISSDGSSWTNVSPLNFSRDLYSVAYGNGRFVAAGNYGFAISTDGANWQAMSFSGPATNNFTGIDFVAGVFLAKTLPGTTLSVDGSLWTPRRWIHYTGPGKIVEAMGSLFSVGDGGTILQSAPLATAPILSAPQTTSSGHFELTVNGQAQQNLRIDVSDDLSTWQAWTNITLTNWTQTIRDGSATSARRFYRGAASQ